MKGRNYFSREDYIKYQLPRGLVKVRDKLSDAVAYLYERDNIPCSAVFYGEQAKPILARDRGRWRRRVESDHLAALHVLWLVDAVDAGEGVPAANIGRRFHTTMVELIAAVCDHIRNETHGDTVVLSGGVFMNALLSSETNAQLRNNGFRVYRHRLVPPNDGGISLGQAAVADARLRARRVS